MDFYPWIYEIQKGRDWHGLSKRFVALLLACVMTFTSVPFTAFAEDGVTGTQPVLEIVEPDAEPETAVTTEAEEQPEENEDILPPDGEEPDENADPENEDNRNVTTEEEAEEDSLKPDSEITELDGEENDQPVPDSEAEEPEDGETEEDPDDADAVPGEDTEDQEEPEDNEETEEDADPEGEEPEEEEQAVPGDITTDAERLTLGLADWWFESPENLLTCEDEHYADYAEVELDPMLGMPAGVSMQLKAENVLAGEYFTVRLPEEMYDVAFASAPAIAGAECELVPVEDPWGCTDLKVTFTEAGSYDEELKLQFTLTAGWGFVIDLQGLGEESCYWVLQPGTVAAAAVFLDEGEGTPVVNYIDAHISSIEFNEIVKKDEDDPGYDWGPLLRPLEFNESSIRIRAYYNNESDEGTVEESVELNLQDSVSADPFYLEFLHDGKGGTDGITIYNIPDSDSEKQFTRYEIWVDTAALPAYSSGDPLSLTIDENTSASTVELGKFTMTVANTQTLTVKPTVGAGDNAEFTFNAVFTNPDAKQSETDTNGKYFVEKQSIEQKLKVPSPATGEITVPVGLNYTVSQEVNSDYRFGGYEKTIPPEEEGGEPDTVLSPDAPTGKIESAVSVTTVNYANNLSKEFTVTWYANGANRPTLTEDHFVLKYKVDGMEEAAPVADHLTDLGYESGKGPAFVEDEENPGHYAFTNLPSVDKDGNLITYTVEREATKWAEDVWQRYTVADEVNEDGTENFVIHEKASFTAYIRWLDGFNGPGKRATDPDQLNLHLYRITDGGQYESVSLPKECINYEGSPWVISIDDLPKYDADNQEYDYVLVQGTIDENGKVIDAPFSIYQTTYNNAVGTQGTDTHLCHNHGSIYNKIETKFDFTATKIWKDDTPDDRAAQGAEVTLWRYAKNPNYNIEGIDDAMARNLASPVVDRVFDRYVYEDGKIIGTVYKDVVKTVTLNGTNNQLIEFDDLHSYDPNGWEYVYFVRENSTGDNYALSYENVLTEGEDAITEGARIGQTVVNTKREKAKINVSVEWKCPSDLDNLNESTSVALTIWAKTENGEYEELTIYDAQLGSFDVLTGDKKATATTVNGFNENITTLDLSFCANIYDANGQPYDMTTAQIREVKIINDKLPGEDHSVTVTYNYYENDPDTGHFSLDGDEYKVASNMTGSNTQPAAGELKEYSYKLTNTITGETDYYLIKTWSDEFSEDELQSFQSVNFNIARTSTAHGSSSETVRQAAVSQKVNEETGKLEHTWRETVQLPKYDSEGYAYSYKATEAGVIKQDGTTAKGFNHYHTYTENSTTAHNYKNGSSSPYFRITKSWLDNGDMDAHGNVYFRIYRKADVRTALQGHDDTELISLSALGAPYAEYSMNGVANNWYREITLADAESKIRKQEKTTPETPPETTLDRDAYLILEYSVDYGMNDMAGFVQSTQSAVYTCAALRTAAEESDTYSASGSVQNSNRQYSTSVSYVMNENITSNYVGTAAFTNTRTGQATLTIEKIWKDPGTNRPDVKFQILRDGRAYNYVPPVVAPSDGSTDGQPTTQPDEQPVIKKLKAEIGKTVCVSADDLAAYLDSNGCITVVTPDGVPNDQITLELVDLPLFSEWGVQYSFNVAEQSLHDYTSEKGDITVAKDTATPDKLTYNYSYTNTRTGTTSHSAYKKWNDIATNGKDRPDLYFTLYQYLVADAEAQNLGKQPTYEELKANGVTLIPIKDKDPVLSIPTNQPSSGSEEGETSAPIFRESDYDMKVTVNNLPAYNEYGQLYGYVLVETMSGSTNGVYENAFGTYVSKTERKVDDSGNVVEIFTNSLIGTTSLSGEKTWLGFVDKYLISKKDWPMPTILLYRSTEKVTLTEENYAELVDSKIELVNTLKSQDKYSFPYVQDMTAEKIAQEVSAGKLVPVTDGDSTTYMLPKFAPDGSRYYYTVWERFDSSDSTTEEAARIAEQLYTKVSANGMLSNTFKNDVNRRKIEVTKSWDLRSYLQSLSSADLAKYWKYPAVTFDLYRYTGETPDFNAEPYATIEIPASDFLENSNGEVTVAFDDLLIYSPDGKTLYKYCVKERPISSYTTEYSCVDEDGTLNAVSTDYVTVTRTPENITDKNITDAVGAKNSYTREEQFNIKGTKYWNDYGNAFGIRPPELELTVTRSAGSGTENVISGAQITLIKKTDQATADRDKHEYFYEWTNTGNDTWTYMIYGLEKYAPNGEQYTYYIREDVPNGYDNTVNTVSTVKASDSVVSGVKTASQLTNKFDGKYEVRKNWVDGNNRYGLRPDNITVVLERSLDNGVTWNKIPWDDNFSSNTSLISVDDYVGAKLYGPDQQKPATHPDNTLANTKGNSWLITINNLPKTVKDGNAYKDAQYRCIEVKIGTENIVDNKAGSYIYREEEVTHSASRSVLKNLLDATQLKVTKEWQDDNNQGTPNAYYSRPASLEFKLQMRGYTEKKDENGNTVFDDDGQPELEYKGDNWIDVQVEGKDTFTLTAANDWKAELKDLPVAYYYTNADGVSGTYYAVQFRAVEVTTTQKQENGENTDNDDPLLEGALNYIDNTSYLVEDQDHKRTNEGSLSTIKNGLIPHDVSKIEVTKIWYRQDETGELTTTFELLHRIKDSGESWHHFYDPISKEWKQVTRVVSTKDCAPQEDGGESFTFFWENLPKYDREHNELEYTVIEHDLSGFRTEDSYVEKSEEYTVGEGENQQTKTRQVRSYTFKNIEEQTYTVQKTWVNTDYAHKDGDAFTSEFVLEQHIAGEKTGEADKWTVVVFPTAPVTPDSTDDPENQEPSAQNEDSGKDCEYMIPAVPAAPQTATVKLSTSKANDSYEEYLPKEKPEEDASGEDEEGTEEPADSEPEEIENPLSHTWTNLPKYTENGKAITYRVRETKINNTPVDANNTNGDYIVSYLYDNAAAPAHGNTVTDATNRMVYGYVNLTKTAAYLAPAVTDGGAPMSGVTFDIYSGTGESKQPYISGVKTNDHGHLICNDDGTYGTGNDAKFLITGTYTLVEAGTHADYSIWASKITFTVGVNGGQDDTGEHGTAWISATEQTPADSAAAAAHGLTLTTEYLHPTTHTAGDKCALMVGTTPAYNLESRGVLSFTKTDGTRDETTGKGNPIDPHKDAGQTESKAWFGVYLNYDSESGKCSDLVAYMTGGDYAEMALTTEGPNGETIKPAEKANAAGVPYLREDTDKGLSLLSGTYYVQELVPPAGYILDIRVREAFVPKLDKNDNTPYSENKGYFTSDEETNPEKNEWANNPNRIKLYKRDQYGRKVDLNGKYLVLSTQGKFLTGDSEIHLYQVFKDGDVPCKDAQDKPFAPGKMPNIQYDAEEECWIISGLLDSGKSYTISEPEGNVPANYLKAPAFAFTMEENGGITVTSEQAQPKDNPLAAVGNDYDNYYHSDDPTVTADCNQVVLRDTSRYLNNVVLEKKNSVTEKYINDIAFGLERYNSTDDKWESVLESGIYLVTDAVTLESSTNDGQIDLQHLTQYVKATTANGKTTYTKEAITDEVFVKNVFTDCDLKYGLDVGTYRFVEIEYGASDTYFLAAPAEFEIRASGEVTVNRDRCTTVDFVTAGEVNGNPNLTQDDGSRTGTLANDPVKRTKLLDLSKVDTSDSAADMSGARFTLVYTSINHDQSSAQTDKDKLTITQNCMTDNDGKLYLADENWEFVTVLDASDSENPVSHKVAPDISNKGDYVLTEIQAPEHYMTRTGSDTANQTPLLTFEVNSENEIVEISSVDGSSDLIVSTLPDELGSTVTSLTLTVNNEKTVVSVSKFDDLVKSVKSKDQTDVNGEPLKGAKLAIYHGQELIWSNKTETSDATGQSEWQLPDGTLIENTVYELQEIEAPVGYLEAKPIYFKIFGTYETKVTKEDGTTETVWKSVIYVQSGTDSEGNPEWSPAQNIRDHKLAMVDEAIIAPVDLLKYVGNEVLPGAKFDVYSLDDNTKLGTAVTNASGHLIWDTISTYGLIYNADGKRITASDAKPTTIILQQNANGYRFTEIYAPDHAYNNGGSYEVTVTDANYLAYKTDTGYNTGKFVDIIAADSDPAVEEQPGTADLGTEYIPLVNPPYKSTVTLTKYDHDKEALKDLIPGTQFTLYRKNVSGNWVQATADDAIAAPESKTETISAGVFATGEDGKLEIEIHKKGEYKLTETEPTSGYSGSAEFTFELKDEPKGSAYGHEGTAELKDASDATGVPNERLMGTVTLEKKDKDAENANMDGVVFTLKRTSTYLENAEVHGLPLNVSFDVKVGKRYMVQQVGTEWKPVEQTGENSGAESGKIIIDGLNWGTYELQEKTEKDGYVFENPKTYTVEVRANQLTPYVDTQNNTNVVPNNKNKLTIAKTDLDGNSLSNAEFYLYEVTKNEQEQFIESSTAQKFYTSAEATQAEGEKITAGTTSIFGLKEGSYVLHEAKAPDGYELASDVFFTIMRNGKIDKDSVKLCTVANSAVTIGDPNEAVAKVTQETTSSTLTVKDKPIEVQLDKLLKDNVALANRGNATFTITGTFADGETSKTLEKNQIADELKAKFIGGKDYEIQETAAPAGYEVQKTPVKIHVNTDGTISVLSTNVNSFFAVDNKENDGVAYMTFTDVPIELILVKTDAAGQNIPQNILGYAKFKVTGLMTTKDGSTPENKTIEELTSENITETFSGCLIGGQTYEVEETYAPNGYKLTPKFNVELDIYGNIKSISTAKASGVNGDTLTVQDDPTVIAFYKVDDDGALAGAKFSLKAKVVDPAVSPAFVNVGEDEPEKITGAKDVIVTADKITWTSTTSPTVIQNMLIADVVYELKELDGENRVPNHEVMGTPIYFHMTKEGKVVIEENGNSTIPNNVGLDAAKVSEDIKMTIQNPIIKGSVTLTKYWKNETGDTLDTSKILPGATYKLTRTVDEHGKAVNEQIKTNAKADGSYAYNPSGTETTFVTDDTGKININGLPEGKYQFQEIAAPMAYHVNADPVTFQIHNGNEAHVTNAQDVDTRINATIKLSKFSESLPLKGANFLVEYREPTTSEYREIGYLTEEKDDAGNGTGVYTMTEGKFNGTTPEGLWRGYYRLTELSAPGQMLNTDDKQTRNTIEFEIGNEIKFIYDVKTGTKFHETDENEIVYMSGGKFISIKDAGVIDTPIPTKNIEVEKLWPNDTDLTKTFRPTSISVQLYRSYTDKDGKTQKEKVGYPETISAGADGKWKHTWQNQPAYFNDASAGEKHVTRLYTYTVEEVTDESYNFWTWYKDDYSYEYPEDGRTSEYEKYAGGEDGDVTAKITNTLDLVPLTIHKTLGGGSTMDAFQVRVILKYDATTFAGNNANGYFMDAYTVVDSATGEKRTPVAQDADGWVTIHGGESLIINLPKGIVYEVQERPVSEGSKLAYEENSDLDYVIRYLSGYSGTLNAAATAEIRNAVVKHLSLTKTKEDGTNGLSGAKFTVSYEPLTGSEYVIPAYTLNCVTNANGVLVDESDNTKPIDLTNQGRYTITETEAPAGYMTPTDNAGNHIPVAVVTVSNLDTMTVAKGSDNAAALVTLNGDNSTGVTADGSTAELTVANQKTVAKIGKTIDYAVPTGKDSQEGTCLTGATLEIQKFGDNKWTTVAGSTDSGSSWTTAATAEETVAGVLSENVQYRLVETKTVVGYKQAADVYFKLDGTYVEDGKRYSRIVITDENGNKLAQNANGAAYGAPGVIGCQLNMVDETIIAPVDLQKVLKSGEGINAKWNALKDVEFTVKQGNTTLGVAVTNENGYLLWQSITKDGYDSNLIYDADGHILTAGGKDTRIILREVIGGYTLTETYAPDHVYNDSRIYPVTVKVGHYDDYRTGATSGLYNSNKYINAVSPDDTLSVRGTTTEYTDETKITTLAENLPYRSTVKLHKYDDNGEAVVGMTIHAVADAEFTLYRVENSKKTAYDKAWNTADATSVIEDGKFLTDDKGDLSITIPEKGTYVLEETNPAKGYDKDAETFDAASFTFVLKDKQEDGAFGQDNTNELKPDGNQNGVPNTRLMGSVTLTKQDKDDENADMNGVVFTLKRISTIIPGATVDGLLLNTSAEPHSYYVTVGKKYEAVKGANGTWSLQETDGTSNKLIITGLNWGTYELQEKTELSGYVHSEEVYEFTIEPEHLDPVFKDRTSNTVLNQKNDVVFCKTNVIDSTVGVSEIKPLESAKFQVHTGTADACTDECEKVMFYLDPKDTDPKVLGDKDVTKKTDTAISGDDGTISIYGLPTGRDSDTAKTAYHMVEIEAPKGYTIQTVPVNFTIDRAGNVVWQDRSTNTSVDDEPVTMTDQPIKISIEKIGESFSDKLSGAEFTLTDICTENCDHKWADGKDDELTLTTDSNGRRMIPIEKVIAGHTYQLEETQAHDGYKRNAVVKFTVKPDGTVELGECSGGYTGTDKNDKTESPATISTAQLIDSGTTIQISNEKIRLSLVKLDYDDFVSAGEDENPVEKVQKLKDVEFTLAPAAGYAFAALEATDGYTTSPQTFKTNENGIIDFPDGLLKCGNSYVLTEKENPDHSYRFSEESITITVDDDGEISFTEPDFFKLSKKSVSPHTIPNILALNQKIHLDIVKVDEVSKDTLSGVVLQLEKQIAGTDDFESVYISGVSDTSGQWKTDDTGKVTFVATTVDSVDYPFTDGTYRLTEISTPVGHNKLTKPLVFEIDRTGKVTTMQDGTDLTAGFFSAFNPTDGKPGEITLTVRNPAYTDLEIHKENPTRTPLKDVEFRLEYRNGSVYNNVKLISDENGTRIDVSDDHIPTVGTADEAKLSTNGDGILTFGSLPDGTYKLTELRTAPGYNLLSQPLIIEINRNTGTYQWKSGESGTWSDLNSPVQNILTMTVINKQGFVFPATGVATPQLPKAILGITAFLEGLVLFLYQRRTKRRRRGAEV